MSSPPLADACARGLLADRKEDREVAAVEIGSHYVGRAVAIEVADSGRDRACPDDIVLRGASGKRRAIAKTHRDSIRVGICGNEVDLAIAIDVEKGRIARAIAGRLV